MFLGEETLEARLPRRGKHPRPVRVAPRFSGRKLYLQPGLGAGAWGFNEVDEGLGKSWKKKLKSIAKKTVNVAAATGVGFITGGPAGAAGAAARQAYRESKGKATALTLRSVGQSAVTGAISQAAVVGAKFAGPKLLSMGAKGGFVKSGFWGGAKVLAGKAALPAALLLPGLLQKKAPPEATAPGETSTTQYQWGDGSLRDTPEPGSDMINQTANLQPPAMTEPGVSPGGSGGGGSGGETPPEVTEAGALGGLPQALSQKVFGVPLWGVMAGSTAAYYLFLRKN